MSTSTTSHADATTSSWATNTTAGTLAAFGIETLTYEAAYKANLLCFLVLSSVYMLCLVRPGAKLTYVDRAGLSLSLSAASLSGFGEVEGI